MRPTSIIFLFISLVVMFTGWFICRNAEAKAAEEQIQLFDSAINAEKDYVNTFEFGQGEIYNKIELVVGDADVYIYGGYSEAKMDLINFSDGSYRMTTANRNINVDTTIDLMSIIKFWESGFSFRGLRNYLHKSDVDATASKRVVVYLPSDSDVNIINITVGTGNVYVSNLDTSVDVNVNIKHGNATLTSFFTTSAFVADIDTGDIYVRDVRINTFEATIRTEGNITAEGCDFGKLNVVGKNSGVSLGVLPAFPDCTMNLSARHGSISLYDEKKGSEYRHEAAAGGSALITVSTGDIIIYRMPDDYVSSGVVDMDAPMTDAAQGDTPGQPSDSSQPAPQQ